ncbi:hypothetical protein POM88_043595 [Heracleum sosnowskyi]|uniref:HORMA domain-containing protein n=1 Tax=Heracleum sosnowskyi TaxID=360622 RepID=A0AAD8H2A0_9APIA|nr:hypothetical protein POM88_043595 [Heracleum sosnowskyi]
MVRIRLRVSDYGWTTQKVPALVMKIKKLMPMDAESRRLIDWMEKGVYDALQKKYPKTLMFCVCEIVEGPMIEEYACPLIMESVDDVLHLSKSFSLEASDPGILVVEFVLSIVWQLIDASLDDEGLLELVPRKSFKWSMKSQYMDIDDHHSFDEKTALRHEGLHKMNTLLAMEVIGDLFRNKVTSRILYLARRNMPASWESIIEGLQILAVNSSALRNSKNITADDLLILTSDAHSVLSGDSNKSSHKKFRAVMASGSLISSSAQCHGARHSALWLPIDIFLEDTMDGSQVVARSATKTLIGMVKALKAVNQTTWHAGCIPWSVGCSFMSCSKGKRPK